VAIRPPADQQPTTDDLELLLNTLPPHIRQPLDRLEHLDQLLEVVLDLGREPEARFPGYETLLSADEVTQEDLEYVVSRVGVFGDDNRAGIPRTLHRISAIRNRTGKIVGLTCRVGRSVRGTMEIIRDFVESGKSILILGKPGVGKTTLLREVARVLADDFRKRVIVVDTSNEIAGDGDIPHPGIGRARRMQVPTPSLQHAVMIEAVENHMPEVIIIDEIGTELEAEAARTIAERGVQLVGTAHGNTLDNLMMNPTLSDLVGGIQPVTLGDEEARRRGTQKTVLERKAPPTFDVLVEMRERQTVAVHRDVAETVDAVLRGQPIAVEIRSRRPDGQIERRIEVPSRYSTADERNRRLGRGRGAEAEYDYGGVSGRGAYGSAGSFGGLGREAYSERVARRPGRGWGRSLVDRGIYERGGDGWDQAAMGGLAGRQPSYVQMLASGAAPRTAPGGAAPSGVAAPGEAGTPHTLAPGEPAGGAVPVLARAPEERAADLEPAEGSALDTGASAAGERFRRTASGALRPLKLYPYGVNRDRLEAAIAALRVPVTLTKEIGDADVVMTLKNYYRKSPGPVREAEERGKPVFILRSNTTGQIEQSLEALYGMETADPPRDLEELVLRETEDAIQQVLRTSRPVELPPQNAYLRRMQHQLAERYNLGSRSTGREPHRRVLLYKPGAGAAR